MNVSLELMDRTAVRSFLFADCRALILLGVKTERPVSNFFRPPSLQLYHTTHAAALPCSSVATIWEFLPTFSRQHTRVHAQTSEPHLLA